MQVLGIIEVFWGGSKVDIKPGGTLKLGGVVNTPVLFGTQVGRAQKMMESEINVKAIVKAGLNVSDTFGTQEQQLQVNCDTGQQFVWDSAFRKEGLTITSGDNSEIDLQFVAGTPMEVS
jgi:hypothetical protein